jgi:hypothetical protein
MFHSYKLFSYYCFLIYMFVLETFMELISMAVVSNYHYWFYFVYNSDLLIVSLYLLILLCLSSCAVSVIVQSSADASH